MAGVFQVDREIFDNSIWQNPAEFRLFFYILGNAVWSEEGVKYGDILVNRGQYLRSYRKLREDLMYVENGATKLYGMATIKRVTDKLVDDGRLKKEETKLGTLFTVVNYNKYQWLQGIKNDNLEQGWNTCGTPAEHLRNNKNKDNKVNKVNNIYSVFDSYSDNENLRQALRDYSLMRNKIKAPLTERAASMLLNKLNTLASSDDSKIKLLEQAIMSNWKSVFPLKEEKQQKPKTNKFHNFIQNDDYTGDDLEEIARKKFESKIKSIQEGGK